MDDLFEDLLKTPFQPQSIFINGNEIAYMRLKIPIKLDNLLGWLDAQTLYPKVYWEDPRDGIIAGVGQALTFDSIPSFDQGVGPRFFGGSDFMKSKKGTWGDFPSSRYFLPLIEVEKRGEKTFLVVNRVSDHVDIHLEDETPLEFNSKVISRFDAPSYPVWEEEINDILRKIGENKLTKVVLARLTELEMESKISPFALLKKLSGTTRYAFQWTPDQIFIGNSPEILYRRKDRLLESAAIAGTRPRGKTEEDDAQFMDELINSPKEMHEFQVVKEMISKTLSHLCHDHTIDDCTVLKTPKVQHLHHSIQGTLHSEIDDTVLIKALHPTPAVGGLPRAEALKELEDREPFDRGWYAAPIGWIAPHAAHLRVGIRSALIEGNILRLWAGTGIVQGSNPLSEWEELEHKISQFMVLL